jgi:DNA-binding transcriptional LysR family regulator
MNPQTIDIETFIEVVEKGSFGRAAGSMLVSQPAISDRILRLENVVGSGLFARRARGVVLTPAGERFLPYAKRIVGLLSEACGAARATDRPERIRVGVHSTFARQAVSMVVGALGDELWSITVRDAHTDQIIEMLLDGVLDVGFVLAGARPPQLRFVPLRPDPVVCVCAPDHDLAGRRRVSVSALSPYKVAFNRWGSGAAEALSLFESARLPVWSWTECPDSTTAVYLAQHCGYLAFVASSFVEDDLAGARMAKVRFQKSARWTVGLTVAFPSKDARKPAIERISRAARC